MELLNSKLNMKKLKEMAKFNINMNVFRELRTNPINTNNK